MLLSIFYIIAIIKMAKQRHFFKKILIHTVVFVSYTFIAHNFETIFQVEEKFGYHKLEFLMLCMCIQIFVGYYLVQSTHRQEKIRQFLGLDKIISSSKLND